MGIVGGEIINALLAPFLIPVSNDKMGGKTKFTVTVAVPVWGGKAFATNDRVTLVGAFNVTDPTCRRVWAIGS